MTARQVWEGMLTELSKAHAPSLLLHEFNYYFNKAINLYINKRYNIYDINQLTTDDLRVLKATALLKPVKAETTYGSFNTGNASIFGATYEVNLPDDYLHMLNCVCIYKMAKNHKCYDKDDYVDFSAKRLTADAWSIIVNDYYNRPLPERPYYYIHNVNTTGKDDEKTYNPVKADGSGTDMVGLYNVDKSNSSAILAGTPETVGTTNQTISYFIGEDEVVSIGGKWYKKDEQTDGVPNEGVSPVTTGKLTETITSNLSDNGGTNFNRVITLNGLKVNTIERETAYRYGNASKVRCEIRYGRDDSVYKLEKVFIDYIKAPQVIRLTKELVDLTEDTSQIMEFPDYVCQEIINELTTLVMARDADPRTQINAQVTQSIANPAQQLTPQQPQQQARG